MVGLRRQGRRFGGVRGTGLHPSHTNHVQPSAREPMTPTSSRSEVRWGAGIRFAPSPRQPRPTISTRTHDLNAVGAPRKGSPSRPPLFYPPFLRARRPLTIDKMERLRLCLNLSIYISVLFSSSPPPWPFPAPPDLLPNPTAVRTGDHFSGSHTEGPDRW